jgi:CHAT domain-containing protein
VVAGRDLTEEGRQLLEGASRGGTTVLSYLVTPDTLVLWVGAPGGEVAVMQRAMPRDSLAELVRAYRAALGVTETGRGRLTLRGGQPIEPEAARGVMAGGIQARRASRRARDSIATALSELLLVPNLDQRLGPAREIVIVPHGSLGLVPFGALPIDSAGTPLGSRFALRYAPSLAAVAEAAARPALPTDAARMTTLRQALVVGNPVMPTTASWGEAFALRPLQGAEVEGRWVAARLKARLFTGPQATEAEVRDRLPGAPLVHLATHGYAYASDARARQSFVALAPAGGHDGFLTVGEILDDPRLTLSAELVVLSACQTGLGDLKQAEGTVGLQRALLARGARSALVSLWSVSDAATDLLMKRFYTHWLDDPDHPSKAEALRRAQEDVRARREFREPKYWAGFQLVGAR